MSLLAILTVVVSLQADPSAAEVLQGLDMTSFRNSTGPRRVEGWRRPADWSFSELTVADGRASLARPGDWIISLRILRTTPEGLLACFSDRAQNGGSYSAQQAVRIVPDDADGYRVAEQDIVDPDCPPFPGQD